MLNKNKLNVACVMDSLESIKYHKDTSYFFLLAAHELGCSVFHIDQGDIFLQHNKPWAQVSRLQLTDKKQLQVQQRETLP